LGSKSPEKVPEIRRDPVTGIWSILAVERSRRPGAVEDEVVRITAPCPFCPGNESLTPPEIWAVGREGGAADSPGWKLRVIPNLYPALSPGAAGKGWRREVKAGLAARGYHEVIIHSPDHRRSLAEMEPGETVRLMRAYRLRYRELAVLPGIRQVVIILNHGRAAGASLEHPHTQVFALPLVPQVLRDELRHTRRRSRQGCPLCAEAAASKSEGRVVAENETWMAFAPYAARFPFETWLMPVRHEPGFERIVHGELEGMAEIIPRVLRGLSRLLEDPPYNLFIHGAPCDGKDYQHYHWHVELIPRITRGAGFELSTGMYINITSPEEAAKQLRETI